ncbi:MAG: hypothetical protein B7Y35_10040 [Sphingomonadales bacterium 28-64-96]|nr:MAG: hypothetical protein B7Y35_10040 [Sphingomonadales bacterium 28-64-96]
MLKEAKRKIAINDNGLRSEITTHEAVVRKMMLGAAKGDRGAQRQYFDQLLSALERQQKEKIDNIGLLAEYKNTQTALRSGPAMFGSEPLWPNPEDIVLDYANFMGEVRGPIDAEQAQPFVDLVDEHRLWKARHDLLLTMSGKFSGDVRAIHGNAIHSIDHLLNTIRDQLPPSFKAQLYWDGGEIAAGILDVEGLNEGEIVDLAKLAPNCHEMVYGLYQLVSAAIAALEKVRDRTRLNISANTTSLINRLRIERQNGGGSAPSAPTVPDFDDYYGDFASEAVGDVDETEQ